MWPRAFVCECRLGPPLLSDAKVLVISHAIRASQRLWVGSSGVDCGLNETSE